MGKREGQDKGDYYTIKRVLDILDILQKETDDKYYLTQPQLLKLLNDRGHECCEKTLTNTLKTLLEAVNPLDDEDGGIPEGYDMEDYRIIVKGLQDKIKARDLGLKSEAKKKLQIRGMRWNPEFTYEDIDKYVEALLFMKNISDEERTYLIEKLQTLTSNYYPDHSKFFSSTTGKVNTKLTSVYENSRTDEAIVRENIKIITEAIEKNERGCKISFHFGGYNKDGEREYRRNPDGTLFEYVADPYQIILNGGKYYLVCSVFDWKVTSMYRIDLMKDIRLDVKKSSDSDKRGIVYRTPRKEIEGLPPYWNAEEASKFLSEHLYNFYGEAKNVTIKIHKDRYTLLRDYFGEHYRFIKHLDETWDEVLVRVVPKALECWAMQNSDYVEILDKNMRENMVKRISGLMRRYEDGE